MRASPPLQRLIQFLRPDVAVIILLLLGYAAFQISFGGLISEIEGLGGDGTIHVTLAGRMGEAIEARDATAYEYRHLLPYVTVSAVFKALGLQYDPILGRPAIILAHRLQNLFFLSLAIFLWGRSLEKLGVSRAVRWLSYPLLLLNFAFTQMPVYHPCNGDSTQFLFGVLMLYAFLHERLLLLAAVGLLSYFVRPGADLYGLALLAFGAVSAARRLPPTRHLASFAAGAVTLLVLVIAVLYFKAPRRVITIQPPVEFLSFVSVPIMATLVFAGLYQLWKNISLRQLWSLRLVPVAAFLVGALVVRLAVGAVAKPHGDVTNELYILITGVAYACSKPAASLVAHMVYFGPVVILCCLLWPRVCRAVEAQGLGMVGLFTVAFMLGLHSESRLLTTPFPFFVAMTCVALEGLRLPRYFPALCVGSGALLSKFWLAMGAGTPWNPQEYPDLLYWINQGPWMPTSMYVIQGALLLILAAIFAWAIYGEDLRAWGRRLSERGPIVSVPESAPPLLQRFRPQPRHVLAGHLVGWLACLAVMLVFIPRIFASLGRGSVGVFVRAAPTLVRNGATELSVIDARYGFPSQPGEVAYEWKLAACSTGGSVSFSNPRGNRTRATFSSPGDYTISVTLEYKADRRKTTESVVVYVTRIASRPLIDFNNDGITDIIWFSRKTGELCLELMNGHDPARLETVLFEPDADYRPAFIGDFEGDGGTDILWRQQVTGALTMHLFRGTTVASKPNPPVRPAPWRVAGVADFDGDGYSDLLWENAETRETRIYALVGGSLRDAIDFSPPRPKGFEIVAVADFNGNRRADVLWHDPEHGRLQIDLSHGAYAATTMELPDVTDRDWRMLAFADFNDDGRTDILWRHSSAAYVQYIDDRLFETNTNEMLVREVEPRLRFAGIGDFDGNGAPDILWRDQVNGALACHLMHPRSRSLGAVTYPLDEMDLSWRVTKLADFDGDGRTDILFRHESSGGGVIYFMNGDKVVGQTTPLMPRGAEFEIVGPPCDHGIIVTR